MHSVQGMMIESQGPEIPNVTLVASFTNVTLTCARLELEMFQSEKSKLIKDKSSSRNRKLLRRSFALAIAFSLAGGSLSQSVEAQVFEGDIPASPWSNSSNQQSRKESSTQRSPELVRQPVGVRSTRYATNERVEESRPAAVTLFGPIAPSNKIQKAPANENQPQDDARPSLEFPSMPSAKSNARSMNTPTTATPKHALTQKTPIEAQSDWHRVQAGGLVIEDPRPSVEISDESEIVEAAPMPTRQGLPERDQDVQLGTSSRMVSTRAGRETVSKSQPIKLRGSSADASNDRTTLKGMESDQAQSGAVEIVAADVAKIQSAPGLSLSSLPKLDSARDELTVNKVADETQMQRVALAQRLSHELLSQSPYPASRAPEILESPPGWQSVEQELKTRLERCDSLLKRGAVHSAREEAVQGMRRLFRTMDLYRRNCISEPALDKALAAFKEEADFQRISSNQAAAVASLVSSHSTEALKGRSLENASPEIASQHYRLYARYQLTVAADGHQWASDLLYAYGKTLEKEAELDTTHAVMFRSQSVVCYQAATQVAPGQSDAANQLGFALINLDRIDEAYQALTVSLQNKPSASAWNNLAELYRRQGAMEKAQYAVQQAAALSSAQPNYTPEQPEVTEVDPAVFARYSPMPSVAPQMQPPMGQMPQNAAGAAVKTSSSSFFSKLIRK